MKSYCTFLILLFFVILPLISMEQEKRFIVIVGGSENNLHCEIYDISSVDKKKIKKLCPQKLRNEAPKKPKKEVQKNNESDLNQQLNNDHALLLGNCLGNILVCIRSLFNAEKDT